MQALSVALLFSDGRGVKVVEAKVVGPDMF